MFNSKKTAPIMTDTGTPNKSDTTILGSGTSFDGTMNSTGIVRVDGAFSGEMNVEGSVIIGESGYVKGNIRSGKVTIAGKIEGNVFCSTTLELTPSGKLFGDVEVKTINIEDGAIFQGKCTMLQETGLIFKDSFNDDRLPEEQVQHDD